MQNAMIKGIYAKLDRENEATRIEKIMKKIGNYLKNRYYIQGIKIIAKKIDYSEFIETNKGICSGKPVIKGTRITPITIADYFFSICEENGYKLEKIIKETISNYPSLDEEKILVSILFCIRKGFIKLK